MVDTLAGSAGNSGGADGTGSAARFDSPSDLAVDSSGNVYVADTDNFTIREVVPSTGAVTTLAGLAGTSGSADGLGSAVRFFHPAGIAVDSSSNLYMADTDNDTVRVGLLSDRAHHPDTAAKPDRDCGQQRPVLCRRLRTSGGDLPVVSQMATAISGATGSSYSISNAQSGNRAAIRSWCPTPWAASRATWRHSPSIQPPSSSSSGGAPSSWFYGALLLLAAVRMIRGWTRIEVGRYR